jgi:PAP2 superfamily C-terminal
MQTFRGRPGYAAARILGPLYVASMCILALAGRKHYSVDIAVAILVSALTFYR